MKFIEVFSTEYFRKEWEEMALISNLCISKKIAVPAEVTKYFEETRAFHECSPLETAVDIYLGSENESGTIRIDLTKVPAQAKELTIKWYEND